MSKRAPVRGGPGRRSATEKRYCTAVVLTAGKGSRMGGKATKQYVEIGGRPLVAYALEVFEASPVIDEIILMTDVGHTEYVRAEIVEAHGPKKMSTIGAGGDERYKSTWKVLCTLMEREEEEGGSAVRDRQNGYVLIHDGTRPFVAGEIIERAYRAIYSYNVCAVGMPVKDTVKLVSQGGVVESSPDRSMVWWAQVPQVFSVSLIVEALTRQMEADCTGIANDAAMVEAQMGVKAQMVVGSYANIKIMTSEDLFTAGALRNSVMQLRILGSGDIGRNMVLCLLSIPN